ncbi:MAG: hypothetical protein ACD_63C00174G0001, partial [uncultured bacterium]
MKNKIFYAHKVAYSTDVEIALQYVDEYSGLVLAFANTIHNAEGGTHLIGFRKALTRVLNKYGRENKLIREKDQNLVGDDVEEGLTAIVSVKVRDPQFEGQTKAKLGNTEVRSAVESVVAEKFMEYLGENPQDARAILGKTLLAAKARLA